ncbi:MAG: hypothetical protein HOV87_10265 [Catenulispora sp.]|nr:hypothetical protein [Catenulispora sp.]
MNEWPVADLDPVRRMRVLASALPGGGFAQLRIEAPVERVWSYVADLDRSIPDLIGFLRRFELRDDGTAIATGLLGNRGRFEVDLRDGWCVMQDRFVVGGFAAVANERAGADQATILAACAAVRIAGVRRIVPLVCSGSFVGDRTVLKTLRKVQRRVEAP